METTEPSPQHTRINPQTWRWIRDLLAIETGILLLFSGLLYLFLDSEVDAHLASAHTTLRSTGAMLAPVLLTLTAFTWVLSSLLLGGYAWLIGRRQSGSPALGLPSLDESPRVEPCREADPIVVVGHSRMHQGWLPIDCSRLRDELKALRQACDARDDQAVEKCFREVEQLIERASD